MIVKTHTLSLNSSCRHCGDLWGVGPDFKRVRALLPKPWRPGTFKVPCPHCGKGNPVKVEKAHQ